MKYTPWKISLLSSILFLEALIIVAYVEVWRKYKFLRIAPYNMHNKLLYIKKNLTFLLNKSILVYLYPFNLWTLWTPRSRNPSVLIWDIFKHFLLSEQKWIIGPVWIFFQVGFCGVITVIVDIGPAVKLSLLIWNIRQTFSQERWDNG